MKGTSKHLCAVDYANPWYFFSIILKNSEYRATRIRIRDKLYIAKRATKVDGEAKHGQMVRHSRHVALPLHGTVRYHAFIYLYVSLYLFHAD